MNNGTNQTPLGVDPTPVTTSLGEMLTAAQASDAGNGTSGDGAAPPVEKPKERPPRPPRKPRPARPTAPTAAAPPEHPVSTPLPTALAPTEGIMSPDELRALVARALEEQRQFTAIRTETEKIDGEIANYRREFREVLNGEPTPLREQVDEQLRLMEDRKVQLLRVLWDSAPTAALVVYMHDDVRMRGEDGLRTAVDEALRQGFIRVLSRREREEARSFQDAHVVELRNEEGSYRAYAAADPNQPSHRYIVSMLRHEKYQCGLQRRAEYRDALEILTKRTVADAIGEVVLPQDALRRIFDPTLPQFVAPMQPPSSQQALHDGTWGFGLRIEALLAAHPKTGRNVKWSGTLLLAVQVVHGVGGTTWKRLIVLKSVGQIATIISERQMYLLPSTDGSPIPIAPGGQLQPPSRSVRLLVEYIRRMVNPPRQDRNGKGMSDELWSDHQHDGELRLLGRLDRARGGKSEPCYIEEIRQRLARGDREDQVHPEHRRRTPNRRRTSGTSGSRGSAAQPTQQGAAHVPPTGTESLDSAAAQLIAAALGTANAAATSDTSPATDAAPPSEGDSDKK